MLAAGSPAAASAFERRSLPLVADRACAHLSVHHRLLDGLGSLKELLRKGGVSLKTLQPTADVLLELAAEECFADLVAHTPHCACTRNTL